MSLHDTLAPFLHGTNLSASLLLFSHLYFMISKINLHFLDAFLMKTYQEIFHLILEN